MKQPEDDSDEEPKPYLTYVNNLSHSLFSNFESYGLYPHKAHISNKFESLAVSNKGMLACQGYSLLKNFRKNFDMYSFAGRSNSSEHG